MDYIKALEEALGIEATKNMLPLQHGDVLETSADTQALYDVIGFKPETTVKDGVKTLWTGIAISTRYKFIRSEYKRGL